MSVDYFGNVCDLEQQLSNAKQSLLSLNDNIRRLAGRNNKVFRSDKSFSDIKKEVFDRERQNRVDKIRRRSYDAKSVFNRLAGASNHSNDVEDARPRINSRVIRELPTKEEVVEAQGMDSESRARNRRIFGSLLGTLHKFCQEESRLKQKVQKKALIEKKLEEQALLERESIKKERDSLFLDKRRKLLEIKLLEIKMSRLKDFKTWEASMLHNKNYIRTKTKPHLYFKPRFMSNHTEQLLAKGKVEVENLITLKREKAYSELNEMNNINEFNGNQIEEFANINCKMFDSKSSVKKDNLLNGVQRLYTAAVPKGVDSKENLEADSEQILNCIAVVKCKQESDVRTIK